MHTPVCVCASVCVCVCVHAPASVCVSAQLKVNSLRLSDSTLKSGGWRLWQRESERERRPIPDIAPVFNAPQNLDNRRSRPLLIALITKLILSRVKVDHLRLYA